MPEGGRHLTETTRLLFGTAGTPHTARRRSTIDGIERVAELGLSCMEIEFVQSVQMGEATAAKVAETAARTGVRLSVHAPYYINLNAREPEKVVASQQRLLKAARIGALCGASSVAFHAAFYMGDPPGQAYETIKRHLAEVLEELDREDNHIWIRPELMGRGTQFGDLEELLRISADLDRVAPCVDFAHWHARTGAYNTYPEFTEVLGRLKEHLGRTALETMHIHVAGIQYTAKGERKHLNLTESDLNYRDLVRALHDCRAGGLLVCESPNLEEDALILQRAYREVSEGRGTA
jgi:deoxyribonuclease-4